MKILGIDTSSMISNITVLDDNKIIGDYLVNQELTHSESLLPMTEDLLKKLGLKVGDMDAICIAKGPGSFTGLRIGMTVAKTLAQILSIDIVAISTLQAMAANVYTDKYILSIVDARGKRVFLGLYKWENSRLVCKMEDTMVNFTTLSDFIDSWDKPLIVVGESDFISDKLKSNRLVEIAPNNLNYGIGKSMVYLAKERLIRGENDNGYNLSPNYIRKSQAELDFDKKNES